jgi:hypothetical protein
MPSMANAVRTYTATVAQLNMVYCVSYVFITVHIQNIGTRLFLATVKRACLRLTSRGAWSC